MKSPSPPGDNLRKDILRGGGRASRTQVVIVVGPPGCVVSDFVFSTIHILSIALGKVLLFLLIRPSGAVKDF